MLIKIVEKSKEGAKSGSDGPIVKQSRMRQVEKLEHDDYLEVVQISAW